MSVTIEELEVRLEKALIIVERHNVLLEGILSRSKEHGEEHEFLREMIKEKKMQNQIKQRVLTNLITGGVFALTGAMLSAMVFYFRDWIAR